MSISNQHGDLNNDPHSTLPHWTSSTPATRFRILRPHAKGGLGEVYVAEDAELHRRVALKQIQQHHADHPEARSRFLLEAEITGGLEHPGIVPVYGLGAYEDGRPFYAMRFIQGDSLQDSADQFHSAIGSSPATFETVAFRKLLQRFIDVCNAIEYAHSRGVLHRDLKPSNIMLGSYGETLVVDWGLAKVTSSPADETAEESRTLRPASASGSAPTQIGVAIGTPAYMSPEQAAGRIDQLGPASDVYSLGATLYYLLTGLAPFARRSPGEGVAALLQRVQAGDLAPPRELQPGVPRALEAICLKSMATAAASRYASPRELADDVERWLADEPVAVHREPLAGRLRRWIRKHPRSIATLAATVVVGLTSLALTTVVVSGKNRLLAAAYESERIAKNEANRKRADAESARQQEHLAKLEEAKARQRAEGVTEYLVQAFRSPDPERAGHTILMSEVLDRSVKDMQDQFQDDPLTKATLLDAVARSYRGLGMYAESIPLSEEARDLRLANLGPEHPDTLDAMNNLALAYLDVGKADLAVPLSEQALKTRQAKFAPDDPKTLTAMHNLAGAYDTAGQLDRAVPLYEEVLKLRRTKLGEDDHGTLATANSLAMAYRRSGQLQRALALLRLTVELHRRKLGSDHPNTLITMDNLAGTFRAAGQLDQALPLYEETLEIRKVKLPPYHPNTLLTMFNLIDPYLVSKQYDRALEVVAGLVEGERHRTANNRIRFVHVLTMVSLFLLDHNQFSGAEPYLRECLELRERITADDWMVFNIKSLLGAALAGQKKFDEAEPLLIAGYEGLKQREDKIPVDAKPRLTEALQRLVDTYTDWEKPEKAAPWQKELDLRKEPASKGNPP